MLVHLRKAILPATANGMKHIKRAASRMTLDQQAIIVGNS
jgi:5,10-methylene-tetrahydrofolate dehydrogenase/methenyl tetrahydrofolate cyclohydrolase